MFMNIRGYSCMSQVGLTPRFRKFVYNNVKSDCDPVLNLVFSVDPVTNLPRNDVGIYMSNDTSPEVRNYIERNLMRENQSIERTGDVDDETLVDTLPYNGESLFNYEKRMSKLIEDEKSKIDQKKIRQKRITRLEKAGYSKDEIDDILSV